MNDAIISAILFSIPTLLAIFLFFRMAALQKKLDAALSGVDDKNLVEIVRRHIQAIEQCEKNMDQVNKEFEKIRAEFASYFRKIAIQRYQGFKDTGGDQSFSLALLDETDSGFIITSLQGRDFSKFYAKRIENGESSHTLTDEEKIVLNNAKSS